jgi:hypothetical protein
MNSMLGRSPIKFSRIPSVTTGIMLLVISMTTQSFALGTENERAACMPDVFRLCAAEIPHVDRIIACMKTKRASLSTPCRQVMDRKPGEVTQSAR